ncbi:MAG: DNA cytosine methyltransferase [Chloroflexi bacterium]|nr:DNA cytosine methyltransferase [Chloroflexota bacterium]
MIARSAASPAIDDKPEGQPSRPLRSLELFTGAGGLALGTHLAGFEHSALVEWNKDACQTLRANAAWGAVPGIEHWRVIEADARTVPVGELGPVDLIAGGPPCQPFSIAGKHQGMDDSRNMIPEFIRAIRQLTPRAFILENVRGLLRQNFRSYLSYVLLELTYPTVTRLPDETWVGHLRRLEDIHTRGRYADLKYNVVFRLLNAADYGVPQLRERVFLVGFRADTGIEWHFPEPTHGADALMHEQWVTGEYWEKHEIAPPSEIPSWARGRGQRIPMRDLQSVEPWRTVRDAIAGLPEPGAHEHADGVYNHRLIPGARAYVGHTGSPLDQPAKTLKAGDHGVPGGENMIAFPDGSVRYFTVREAARMQTFPDRWRIEGYWSEAMRQLGNAVPVELAHVVANSVGRTLRDALHERTGARPCPRPRRRPAPRNRTPRHP